MLRGPAAKKSLMISTPLNRTKQKGASHSPKQLIKPSGDHAEELGIEKEAEERAVEYLQWSAACENAAIDANKHLYKDDGRSHKGRGRMPLYRMMSTADKSSHKAIDHVIWQMAPEHARIGSDLYSTLWHALAGILETFSNAQKLDSKNDGKDQNDHKDYFGGKSWKHRFKMQKIYFPFLNFIFNDPKSIFYDSLKKLEKENEKWQWILHLALFREPEEVHEWAKEARTIV